MRIFLRVRLEGALRIFFAKFLLSHLLLLKILAQIADDKEVTVRNALLRYLDVDWVLGEDAVCPLDHLASVFLSHVFAVRVDGRLEGTLLFWSSSPQFLGVIAEESVPEEAVEVCVYLLPLFLIDALVVSDLHLVDASNCEEEDEETGLGYCVVAE